MTTSQRRAVESPRGLAWLEPTGTDMFSVYAGQGDVQPVGLIVIIGREKSDLKYTWSASTEDDAPNGVEASEEDAVAAIYAARDS